MISEQFTFDPSMKNITLTKGSKVTALGPLPKDWEVVRLGEIIEFSKKPRYLKINPDEEVPFIAMECISENSPKAKWIFRKFQEISSGTFVFKGDILIAKITPCFENGKQAILNDLPKSFGYATTEVWPIHPKNEKVLTEYIYHFLRLPFIRKSLASKMEGATGRQRLPRHVLENLLIPLPPLPEQKAIARVLKAIQDAIEATERVIAAAKGLKKSLMRHLFTYGPVPVSERDRVRLKQTEIGPIPEDWEVVRLGEIGDIITGRTPSTKEKTYWNGNIPFITPVDLTGRKVLETERYISEKGLKGAKPLPKGSVLVSCIGYIGKVGMVGTEIAVTNQQINAIIPDPQRVDNWFLLFAVSKFSDFFIKKARMTTVPILNKSNFANCFIPLPPLPVQQKIAQILKAVDDKIEAEEKKKEALQALFKTMLHHLMTGKIRVKISEEQNND